MIFGDLAFISQMRQLTSAPCLRTPEELRFGEFWDPGPRQQDSKVLKLTGPSNLDSRPVRSPKGRSPFPGGMNGDVWQVCM